MEKTSLIMFGKTVTYQHENIWVKPVCDFLKIDSEKQVVKIKNDLM